MKTIEVKGMSCGHCVQTITQAIQQLDQQAEVKVDLPSGQVSVESSRLPLEAIADAITGAGYVTGKW